MSALAEERIPVVIASGQAVERTGTTTVAELAERAARAAIDQLVRPPRELDRLSFVRTLSPASPAPASAIARMLGIQASQVETTTMGGNTPQWLVTRAAAEIAAGRLQSTLVVGAEAIASARRGGWAPAPLGDDQPDPVVGDPRPGTSPQEKAVGLQLPAQVYPMFEQALASRLGNRQDAHRRYLGQLMAHFTEVAAGHRCAWFPERRDAGEIATTGAGNRLTADPYTTRMNAMIVVDQAAAVMVTSLAAARRMGAADRAVFVWSGADASDAWFPPERPDLATSPGIAAAGAACLDAAGVSVDELGLFDLYSCFPIAVEMAAAALGVATNDSRGLTVTGGLPYFGGPGNNYSTHAIATMTERLLAAGGTGMVTGLGWFATKHSVGVYGASPPPRGFAAGDTSRAQQAIDAAALPVADTYEGPATVDAGTVVYDRDGNAVFAPVYARLPGGVRAVAAAHPEELAALAGRNLVGAAIHVSGTPPTFRITDQTTLKESE
ncbi:MAG TPA: hypothetical protein VFP54_04540 [Acidimicrobiales bacterium]|nr:hypothetical protein [Acidimicrobiales bacterium]